MTKDGEMKHVTMQEILAGAPTMQEFLAEIGAIDARDLVADALTADLPFASMEAEALTSYLPFASLDEAAYMARTAHGSKK
jgi:hypothetical protein